MTKGKCLKTHCHCWHYVGSIFDGLGNETAREACCFCDLLREREYIWKDDPKHGPYAEVPKIRKETR